VRITGTVHWRGGRNLSTKRRPDRSMATKTLTRFAIRLDYPKLSIGSYLPELQEESRTYEVFQLPSVPQPGGWTIGSLSSDRFIRVAAEAAE
jgi:hypothetical protein